jgi:hypothetical protein
MYAVLRGCVFYWIPIKTGGDSCRVVLYEITNKAKCEVIDSFNGIRGVVMGYVCMKFHFYRYWITEAAIKSGIDLQSKIVMA